MCGCARGGGVGWGVEDIRHCTRRHQRTQFGDGRKVDTARYAISISRAAIHHAHETQKPFASLEPLHGFLGASCWAYIRLSVALVPKAIHFNSLYALSRSSLTTTTSKKPGLSMYNISPRAARNRTWILSSVSVPRDRNLSSSASCEGGATKMNKAFSEVFLTASAPCTSMSSRHVLPAAETASTAANEVPYMLECTCAYSINSPRLIADSISALLLKW
mmetsp:Transcript_67038/g.111445  ORF Transcript_67038/g.111445 Transcript_67038/m.111445 type:complete len:219 (-) Transcript_67038:330-986(-)